MWKCFLVRVVPKEVQREDQRTFTHVFQDDQGNEWIGEDRLPIGAVWKSPATNVYGVKLPGDCGLNRFCPTLQYSGFSWTIDGNWPDVTISPSIHHVGHYHGTIKNGQISDDCEGRKYNEFGIRLS